MRRTFGCRRYLRFVEVVISFVSGWINLFALDDDVSSILVRVGDTRVVTGTCCPR